MECVAHIACHFFEESCLYAHFVAAYVYVGSPCESGSHFVENLFKGGASPCALHVETHGLGEHIAVSGHVDFGYDGDAVLGGIILYLTAFCLRVELAGVACHVAVGGEFGVGIHLKTPRQLLCEVPVEHVHLEARQQSYLLLQLFHRQERPAHILHPSAQLEGGPVGDAHEFEFGSCTVVVSFGELCQCLYGACHSYCRHCLYADGVVGDVERVCLVVESGEGVVVCSFYVVCNRDAHFCLGVIACGAAVVGKELAQSLVAGGIVQLYASVQ